LACQFVDRTRTAVIKENVFSETSEATYWSAERVSDLPWTFTVG